MFISKERLKKLEARIEFLERNGRHKNEILNTLHYNFWEFVAACGWKYGSPTIDRYNSFTKIKTAKPRQKAR